LVATVDKIFESQAASPTTGTGAVRLWLLLNLELLIIAALRLPHDLGFNAFAFGDRGSWLTLHYLVTHGGRPALDFGYQYGLLPIWLSEIWFGLFGATPHAYQAAMVVCGLLITWPIARILQICRRRFVCTALAMTALPFAVQSSYPSMAHAVEAVLLCNALAEQAAGRRNIALALATAACLVKPSMGYVYSFVLLVFIALDLHRRGLLGTGRAERCELCRMLAPAAITGISLILVLAAIYGPISLAMTLLPITGVKNYAAMNYGFFHGMGSYFWYGIPVLYYFGSVIGFWFAASLWLIAAAMIALWGLLRGGDETTGRWNEFVLSAALLHVAFVTVFFGGSSSWSYYSYIPVIGAIAACTADRTRCAIVGTALTVLAASGQTSFRVADLISWRDLTPAADTAGLWASADERSAWTAALDSLGGRKAALISGEGAAPLLFPQFEQYDFLCVVPGDISAEQFDHAMREFSQAPMIVAVVDPLFGDALDFWPPLRNLLARRELVLRSRFFAAYRKRGGEAQARPAGSNRVDAPFAARLRLSAHQHL